MEPMRKGTSAAGRTSKQDTMDPSVLRKLQKLDWKTRDFASSVTKASRNAFERLLLLSKEQIYHLELRACLVNARDREPDPGGNIWHDYVSPRDGSQWVFCVDHETSAIFGGIYPAEVFEVLYASEILDEEYADARGRPDPRKLRALYKEKVPHLTKSEETQLTQHLHGLWARTYWLVDLLYNERMGDLEVPSEKLEAELSQPTFRDAPALALYWLWRTFFLDDAPALARVLEEARQSHLGLIRDAAKLVERLQKGRDRTLGPVDDVLQVRAEFLEALKPKSTRARKRSSR